MIASRGRTEECPWKPEMIVDGNGIGHGFNENIGNITIMRWLRVC